MPRRLCLAATLALTLLALGGLSAAAAHPRKAAVGDYQSAPVIAANRDYSVGVFSVERDGRKRWIVPTDGYAGIYYPDANDCDDLDLPLAATRIPISAKGRFRHHERTRVAGARRVKVNWKGRFKRRGVVKGSIRIKHAGCRSTRKWTGGKVSAAG